MYIALNENADTRLVTQHLTTRPGPPRGYAQQPVQYNNEVYILHTVVHVNNNHNKRPLTPKSMPPAGDEYAKLKT